ncbi:MAG: YkgJ family cysteine cluster protein [Leptospiraceae bacterium]|nr:YkgJ family cysteine cluster protein [Leptospiraceae bacterium]
MHITEERVARTLEGQSFDFKCTGCGNCCKGPGDVYFTEEELKSLKEYLKLSAWAFSRLKKRLIQDTIPGYYVHRSGEACLFLEDNRCTVYPVRPLQCRTFPFWTSNFNSKSNFRHLQKDCPGTMSGLGPALDAAKVTARIQKTETAFLRPQHEADDPIML